eukprot:TRINITY_DN6623_c2_g1_i1.p1 TRINITY_DN6623_c2_g1~~TRINITY_DN6623_c2_g1_i1.p1  ORF type:complete len:726 (+),score=92.61 TRINITY_DN6623_c2_g1_i1:37-2214(+)
MSVLFLLLSCIATSDLAIVASDEATISPILLASSDGGCNDLLYLKQTSDLTVICKNSGGYQFAVRANLLQKPEIGCDIISETAIKTRLDSPFRIRQLSNTTVLMLQSEALSVRNWVSGSLDTEIATRGGSRVNDIQIIHVGIRSYIIAYDDNSVKMSSYMLQGSVFDINWHVFYSSRTYPVTSLAVSESGYIAFDDGDKVQILHITNPHQIFASFSTPQTRSPSDKKLKLLFRNDVLLVAGAYDIGFRAFSVTDEGVAELGTHALGTSGPTYMDLIGKYVIINTVEGSIHYSLDTHKATAITLCPPGETPGAMEAISGDWVVVICRGDVVTIRSAQLSDAPTSFNVHTLPPSVSVSKPGDKETTLLVVIAALSVLVACSFTVSVILYRKFKRGTSHHHLGGPTAVAIDMTTNSLNEELNEEMNAIYLEDTQQNSHMIPWEPFLKTKTPIQSNVQKGMFSAIRYKREPVTLIPLVHSEDCESINTAILNSEVADLSEIAHESIVRVLGWSCSVKSNSEEVIPQNIFIVSEHCAQGSLMDTNMGGRELTCLKLVSICRALSSLHASGFVHNAVCSRNVLPTASGEMKLILLPGVTVCSGRRLDLPKQLLPWGSPELLQSGISVASNDIYSFGCLLFEVLTASQPPPPVGFLQTVVPTTPIRKALWKLIDHCCSSEPASRPSMAHLLKTMKSLSKSNSSIDMTTSTEYVDEFDDGLSNTAYSYYENPE